MVIIVNIRFTSSLTAEDENLLAPAVLAALTSILDLLPIAYMIRIDTSDSRVRAAFTALVAARRTRITDVFRHSRVDMVELSTAESMVDPLVRFILRRRRRRWSLPGR